VGAGIWNRQCSETLAFKLQTPVNHPEESKRHSEQGESLKSRTNNCVGKTGSPFLFCYTIFLRRTYPFVYIPRTLCSLHVTPTCPNVAVVFSVNSQSKVNVKVTLEHDMKVQRGSRGIALLFV
jgi:hypothetical protein